MASYPIEIRRCRHVKTNGTQCGSPALKGKELCFYHEQNRPQPAELYMDGERYCDSQVVLPVFEDAHAIQTVIRQVVQLMLARRIERKDAGLLLYAMQIASGNLKMMQAEKAKPTQVVVEPDKAAETPLGMTPWSASGQGHDCDETEGGDDPEAQESPALLELPEEIYAAITVEDRVTMRRDYERKGLIRPGEIDAYFWHGAPDPLLLAITRLWEEGERKRSQSASLESAGEQTMPPGTIQACQGTRARMVSAVG